MRKILLLTLLQLLVLILPIYAQEVNEPVNIVSINDIKSLMAEKFESIIDYTADFKWINGNVHYYGSIQYKKPDMILLNFEEPREQKIISNGKTLYIYIPYLKVVAQQSLGEDTESTILETTSEKGLAKLFEEYSFSFFDNSELQPFGSIMAYHLKLQQKKPQVGFKKMDIWVAQNGLILQSNGDSPGGVNVSLSFSNIRLNTELPDYIFDFEVPADAQIIRNLIIPFTEKD